MRWHTVTEAMTCWIVDKINLAAEELFVLVDSFTENALIRKVNHE
jgi:hypothetical protein